MPDGSANVISFTARAGRFLTNEEGATAIEYAMIASLLSMVIIGSVVMLGGGVSEMWAFIRDEVVAGLAS